MRWVLRLIGTGDAICWQSADLMEISRRADVGAIADLGLSLSEAKQLLKRVQQAAVAGQTDEHAQFTPIAWAVAVGATGRTGALAGSRHYSVEWWCDFLGSSVPFATASQKASIGLDTVGRRLSCGKFRPICRRDDVSRCRRPMTAPAAGHRWNEP